MFLFYLIVLKSYVEIIAGIKIYEHGAPCGVDKKT